MTVKKNHDRKLVVVGVSLTKARPPKFDLKIMGQVRDDIEAVMLASDYLEDAPFELVSLMFRYGLVNEDAPHFQRISKKWGDLPLAIELDIRELRNLEEEGLAKRFAEATLVSLIHAGGKYDRPIVPLLDRLAELREE